MLIYIESSFCHSLLTTCLRLPKLLRWAYRSRISSSSGMFGINQRRNVCKLACGSPVLQTLERLQQSDQSRTRNTDKYYTLQEKVGNTVSYNNVSKEILI